MKTKKIVEPHPDITDLFWLVPCILGLFLALLRYALNDPSIAPLSIFSFGFSSGTAFMRIYGPNAQKEKDAKN